MAAKVVGQFRYLDGSLYGPKEYMTEQGNARLNLILAGKDTAFNQTSHLSPDIVTAILVWLQTDYAGWKGYRDFEARTRH